MRLWTVIFLCFIKYRETNNSTVQVPFIMAFSFGKNGVNDGIVSGPGITFLFNSTTTANTNTDTTATNRNINLSVMLLF